MIHFCHNPMCPNYSLELNEEWHYHSGDPNVYGGICGILKSHKVSLDREVTVFEKKFLRNVESIEIKTVHFHYCDVCYNMMNLLKEYSND